MNFEQKAHFFIWQLIQKNNALTKKNTHSKTKLSKFEHELASQCEKLTFLVHFVFGSRFILPGKRAKRPPRADSAYTCAFSFQGRYCGPELSRLSMRCLQIVESTDRQTLVSFFFNANESALGHHYFKEKGQFQILKFAMLALNIFFST